MINASLGPRMDTTGFRHQVVSGRAHFMRLKADWEQLLERSQSIARPFLMHDWVRNWLDHFGPKYEPLMVLVYRREKLVAIAPLWRYPNSRVGAIWTTFAFMGDPGADYHDLIVDESMDAQEVYSYTLNVLADMGKRYATLRFQNVHSESAARFANALPTAATTLVRCPYVDTRRSTWEDYQRDILTKKMRYALKRGKKAGHLEYHVISNHSDIDPFMKTLFDMHIKRWDGDSAMKLEGVRSVLTNLAHDYMRQSRLHLAYLSIGGEVAASTYGFRDRKRLYCYLKAHNPDMGRLSPGTLMIYFLLSHEYGQFDVIDFMQGTTPYKYHWANGETYTRTYRLYRSRLHKAVHARLIRQVATDEDEL